MAGFADLVARAQPALAVVNGAATEGRTWKWTFTDIVDDAGAAVDMATSVTATCKVVTKAGGNDIATLTYAGGTGTFTISLASGSTAGLAGSYLKRTCYWFLKLEKAGESIDVWGATDSKFIISQAS